MASVASQGAALMDIAPPAPSKPGKAKDGTTSKAKRPPAKEGRAASGRDSNTTKSNGAAAPQAPSSGITQGSASVENEAGSQSQAAGAPSQPAPETDLVQCKHCKKPVPASTAAAHAKACLKEKQERLKKKRDAKEAKDAAAKAEAAAKEAAAAAAAAAAATDLPQDGEAGKADMLEKDESGMAADGQSKPTLEENDAATEPGTEKAQAAKKGAAKPPAAVAEDGVKKSKKRKAEGDAEKAPKPKKKKEEAKPKLPKPKGPIDVEKHCGVLLPNGAQCARSLTCKSHSMGSKRAVPGRSLPYDMLLHAYQKKNQAKQQRAAIDANAPLQEELDNQNGPVDSDEERDAVMAAIARCRPQPLEKNIPISTLRKYQYMRLKETLASAIASNSAGGGLFAVVGSGSRSNRQSISVPNGGDVDH